MLAQRSGEFDPVAHGDLLNSMGQLERNARDLQESEMSIRMMPMEYVFSRFPRLVWCAIWRASSAKRWC
nr:Chemotaxis protein CheA [Candidatus Pantoea persica]